MDHQGAGRTRRAAGTRRQPPWPSADSPTGSLPVQDDGDAYPPDDGGFPEQPPPGGPAAPAGRRRGGGRTRRRTRSRVAWIAVAAVIAAGAGFAGYKYLYEARVNAPVPP